MPRMNVSDELRIDDDTFASARMQEPEPVDNQVRERPHWGNFNVPSSSVAGMTKPFDWSGFTMVTVYNKVPSALTLAKQPAQPRDTVEQTSSRDSVSTAPAIGSLIEGIARRRRMPVGKAPALGRNSMPGSLDLSLRRPEDLAAASVSSPDRQEMAGIRLGLVSDMKVKPKPLHASDFVGSKARNQLPVILIDATQSGAVLSVANTMAILAGFGPGPGHVVVADIASSHIAGVQHILRLAKESPDQASWLRAVKQMYPNVGRQLDLSLRRLGMHGSFSHLKARIASDRFSFFSIDLADENALSTLSKASPSGFAAVYTSNIEMYLAGFLNGGTRSDEDRQAKLDHFRTNVLGLMNERTKFIHAGAGVRMDITEGLENAKAWQPHAAAFVE